LSVTLAYRLTETKILSASKVFYDESKIDRDTLIVAIGKDNIVTASKKFPENDKLFLSIVPVDGEPVSIDGRNSSLLYISQPVCRQVQFIKALDPKWRSIGLITSDKSTLSKTTISSCSKTNTLTTNIATIDSSSQLTIRLKEILADSDLLLAQPDSSIYNSKTVKNILLTSYRSRKPVIGFSKNFSKAGALASIYSTPTQIAETATSIIDNYIASGNRFTRKENYTDDFEISLNRQVFRALDMDLPDIEKLKDEIEASANRRSADRKGSPK
jgi:ABC-type uncharacterized transport system substrate-binding protein